MATTDHRLALPQGTRVQDFEFHRVLGHGGFGITYLGWNVALDIAVAIKEYLPADLAVRERDLSVLPKSSGDETDFQWGLGRFLDEARVMARFKHPNIVQVQHFFQAHGTAYIVMEYVEGETLSDHLKRRGTLTETELKNLLLPLLAGLVDVHEAGILHRDIKPGNLLLRAADGSPVLVDFGAARQAVGARSRSVTAVLTPGYAPIEQYSSRGHQGPWTDIYALGGVCYQALTGKVPDEAMDRIRSDPLTPVIEAGRGNASAVFLSAIDWALRVEESGRPQGVRQWRAALLGESEIPEPASSSPPGSEARDGKSKPAASKITRWLPALGLVLLAGIGAWWGYQTYQEWFGVVLSRVEWRVEEERQRRTEAEARQVEMGRQEAPAEMPEAIPQGAGAGDTEAASARADAAPPESSTASAGPEIPETPPEEEDEVSRLLAAAEADLTARRLTSPAGSNAWDRYRRVLELDPANAAAVKGMEMVIEGYRELFAAALGQEDFEKAAAYLAKVGELHPDSPVLEEGEWSLAAARQARAERLAEQERQRRAEAEHRRQEAEAKARQYAGEMLAIPAGSFRMGDLSGEGDDDEKPVHSVTIPAFKLGKYEVTFAQWDACVADGGCFGDPPSDWGWGRGNRPVIMVTWKQVQSFIKWLNGKTGGNYRLPTEAEWEYAARAGTTTKYSWGDDIGSNRANCDGCGSRWDDDRTAPVGSFPANAWGLYDMHGNVAEWVQDRMVRNYRGAPTDGSAWIGDSGDVIRGGAWNDVPRDLRSAARDGYGILYGSTIGFRLAHNE